VECISQEGDRLNYKLVKGEGPETGWVSISINGKILLEEKAEEVTEWGGPGGADAPAIEVDEALKKKIIAKHEEKKKEGALLLYVMKYKVLGYPLASCKFRIFCFHNAGGAESAYTGPGTELMKWVKDRGDTEICGIDYPGRDKLIKATKFTDTAQLAEDLMAVLYEKVTDGVPYVVWAHSVGTWVCFEFLQLARKIGVPMPEAAFLNAFPGPHLPFSERPWPQSKKGGEPLIKEILLNWDKGHLGGAGKVVFDQPGWDTMWKPMMTADFQLYDEYKFSHTGSPKFSFPIHTCHMADEHYNKKEMLELWKDWTTGEFELTELQGMGHLTCFYKPDCKKTYFAKVMEGIKKYVPA
jgi:surfactin synthase thioesterase subunit